MGFLSYVKNQYKFHNGGIASDKFLGNCSVRLDSDRDFTVRPGSGGLANWKQNRSERVKAVAQLQNLIATSAGQDSAKTVMGKHWVAGMGRSGPLVFQKKKITLNEALRKKEHAIQMKGPSAHGLYNALTRARLSILVADAIATGMLRAMPAGEDMYPLSLVQEQRILRSVAYEILKLMQSASGGSGSGQTVELQRIARTVLKTLALSSGRLGAKAGTLGSDEWRAEVDTHLQEAKPHELVNLLSAEVEHRA